MTREFPPPGPQGLSGRQAAGECQVTWPPLLSDFAGGQCQAHDRVAESEPQERPPQRAGQAPQPGRWTALSGGAWGACSPRGPALPPLRTTVVTWEQASGAAAGSRGRKFRVQAVSQL